MAEGQFVVLRKVRLSARHVSTGRTRHFDGNRELAAPVELRIVRSPSDQGVWLFYMDANGVEQTDTYHETMAEALAQAEWEFGLLPREWELTGG